MVAEGDLGRAELAGDAVEHAAAQARAQRAGGLALGNHALHHRVGVLILDVEGHAQFLEVGGQHFGRKTRLLLVEVHGDELEAHRRDLAQLQQDVEERMAVLAAGEADHDAVAVLDHVEVADGLADVAAQALGQLVGLVAFLLPEFFRQQCLEIVAHSTKLLPPSTAMTWPVT